MTRRKSKKTKEEQERERLESIMFGKMCGCGDCKYCRVWEIEKLWMSMQEMVEEERERPTKWEDVKW